LIPAIRSVAHGHTIGGEIGVDWGCLSALSPVLDTVFIVTLFCKNNCARRYSSGPIRNEWDSLKNITKQFGDLTAVDAVHV